MDKLIGVIKTPPKLTGNIKAEKVYPDLEDLEITPSNQEQNFKSEKYGYDNVKVKAVEGEDLNISPSFQEQHYEGIFKSVTAEAMPSNELTITPTAEEQVHEGLYKKVTIPPEPNYIPENIKEGTKMWGLEGTLSKKGVEMYVVRVVDYDGTIIKEEELSKGEVFTMPEPPEHDNLIFQEWSSPVDIVDNKVVVDDYDIVIGPTYDTTSGATEIDIEINRATTLNISLGSYSGKTSVDWGDGTIDNASSHIYANYGKYTIRIYDAYTIVSSILSGKCQYGVKEVRISSSVTRLQGDIFSSTYSPAIERISIPNSITITTTDFGNLRKLRCLIIPMSFTEITNNYCSSCESLENVVIPKSITKIGNYAFSGCNLLKELTIPYGVIELGTWIFRYNPNMRRLKIPDSVTSIGEYAFTSMYNITEIKIPKKINSTDFKSVYSSSRSLKKATIPLGVTNIDYACNGTMIEEVEIPESVTSVQNSFYGCYLLGKVKFPDNITILKSTCSDCYSLKQVILPKYLQIIDQSSFYECRVLEEIEIPETLESINTNAFKYCYSLIKYDFTKVKAVPTLSNTNAFDNINKAAKIIVPDNLYDEWIAATNWSTYADYIYKASEVLV